MFNNNNKDNKGTDIFSGGGGANATLGLFSNQN